MQLISIRRLVTIGLICLSASVGCTTPWFIKSNSNSAEARRERIRKRLESPERPTSIFEIAAPRQLAFGALENVGLVTHLPGTGGIVKPSAQREKLLDIMRKNDVADPNTLLDSKQTAMVAAMTAVPPAVRKGERVNVSIKLSAQAEASDLRQGWLRETSLVEMGNLGGKIRESFERARAEGPLVTLAQYTGSDDPQSNLEAVVVGGARMLKSRELGLAITPDFADALTMAMILPAINDRFTFFDGRRQSGVATPLSDEYIELQIPPRYAADPYHFINVILQIHFNESPAQQTERLANLAKDIQNSQNVAESCYALEAVGDSAKEILVAQINNPNPEIQFFTAHSLAYLGDTRAVPALVALAVNEPKYRVHCLNALASLDHFQAEEALRSLLSQGDPETRYGAVRAMRRRNARDPLIIGEQVSKVGSLLEIPANGPDFVAVSMIETPEIVFFGHVPRLNIHGFHNVNASLLLQPTGQDEVTITRFVPGASDMTATCKNDLRSVLQAIAQVGGGYGDWVSFVRECQEQRLIDIPVAMNPVPAAGGLNPTQASPNEGDLANNSSESATPNESTGEDVNPSAEDYAWYAPWSWLSKKGSE